MADTRWPLASLRRVFGWSWTLQFVQHPALCRSTLPDRPDARKDNLLTMPHRLSHSFLSRSHPLHSFSHSFYPLALLRLSNCSSFFPCLGPTFSVLSTIPFLRLLQPSDFRASGCPVFSLFALRCHSPSLSSAPGAHFGRSIDSALAAVAPCLRVISPLDPLPPCFFSSRVLVIARTSFRPRPPFSALSAPPPLVNSLQVLHR